MRFHLTAYRQGEGIVALTLEAANLEDVKSQAQQQGLDIVSVRQSLGLRPTLNRQRDFDLLLFSQELRSLLDAGLSIIEAMGTLARKETTAGRKTLLENLIRHLREGKPFSAAVQEYPDLFPPLYIALISASERTGDLASALGRFVDYRNQTDAVKKRVTAAAIYPLLLIGVGGLVILFLMTYVVPRFSHIYEDFGRNLPWTSKLLMQWCGLVESHGLLVLSVIVMAITLTVASLRRQGGWTAVLGWFAASKSLRERFHIYALSRFYRTLGMLQQGGIPIVPALGLARDLLGPELQAAVEQALTDIRAGTALSTALERQNLAPPVASDLLKVGEKTGDIGDKMIRIADFYDEDISRWIEWFARLFEPLLMLGIGCFIALIIVLLYLPIFDLAGTVQ